MGAGGLGLRHAHARLPPHFRVRERLLKLPPHLDVTPRPSAPLEKAFKWTEVRSGKSGSSRLRGGWFWEIRFFIRAFAFQVMPARTVRRGS